MIHHFSSLLSGFIGVVIGVSLGQEARPQPVIFTTPPQRVDLRVAGAPPIYHGLASLTLLEAGSDDTLRTLLVVTLPAAERRRIKAIGGASASAAGGELPETIGRVELRLRWRKGTSCPDIDLELPAVKLMVNGLQLETSATRARIDVSLRTVETLPQLLCGWTRQINAGRPRQGIIMAINRLLIRAD